MAATEAMTSGASPFRAEQALVEQAARQENLAILTDTVITDLHADNGELEHLLLKNANGRETRLPVSGLFVAFGRVPDTEMAAALAVFLIPV